MPARDSYHGSVKRALVKAGWTITHDPLRLAWGGKDMYVDLGAERSTEEIVRWIPKIDWHTTAT